MLKWKYYLAAKLHPLWNNISCVFMEPKIRVLPHFFHQASGKFNHDLNNGLLLSLKITSQEVTKNITCIWCGAHFHLLLCFTKYISVQVYWLTRSFRDSVHNWLSKCTCSPTGYRCSFNSFSSLTQRWDWLRLSQPYNPIYYNAFHVVQLFRALKHAHLCALAIRQPLAVFNC